MTIKYHKISFEFNKITFKNNNLWIVSTYLKDEEFLQEYLQLKWVRKFTFTHSVN